MMLEIKIFLFVLSVIFTLRFLLEFVIKLFEENPSVLVISKYNQGFLYFAISYIITYFFI
jgi:hypothetical protein